MRASKRTRPTSSRAALELSKAVDAAGSQYAKGEVKAAKASLKGILAQLDGLSGEERCPDVRTRVAGNLGKIKRLVDVLATLNKGLTKCEPEALRHEHEQLSGATHVKLVASRAQLLRAVPVAERYTQARLAYKEGRIEDAASLFQTALTKAEEAQAPTCVDIEKRTRSNLARIDQMKELERSISGVIDQCDMAAMERRKAQLLGSTNPFLIKLHTRLSNPPARCQQLVSNRQCADQFGGGWTAGPADEKGTDLLSPAQRGRRQPLVRGAQRGQRLGRRRGAGERLVRVLLRPMAARRAPRSPIAGSSTGAVSSRSISTKANGTAATGPSR